MSPARAVDESAVLVKSAELSVAGGKSPDKEELSGFNESQRSAILHTKGPCLVLAGPGSGKTTVITRRLRNMILRHSIPPQGILVVTFTKSAAKEMQLRFETLMGSKMPVSFGTFHAIFFRILREHERDNPPTLIKEKQKTELIQNIMRRHGISIREYAQVQTFFSRIKNGQEPIRECEKEELSAYDTGRINLMFEDYRRSCKEGHLLDFDDMAYEVLRLFKEDSSALKRWQRRFEYILVDEYQDIAPSQESIVALLASPQNNLFVVGDDDQSIYGFRGAGTELMLGFEKRYEGARTILLDTNYRSRPGIIEAAIKVVKENKKRFDKVQKAAREPSENPAREILIKGFKDRADQNRGLIEDLRVLLSEGKLSKACVLYRKNKDAMELEELLKKARLPFVRAKREQGILSHFIACDVTAYLRLFKGDRTRANFYKVMNRPFRGIDRQAVDTERDISLRQIARYHIYEPGVIREIKRLSEAIVRCGDMSIYACLMYIRKRVGYEDFLKSEFKGSALDENLQVLDVLQELSKDIESLEGWMEMMERGDVPERNKDHSDEEGVRIMTYHGSKGLEFDHIFLPDLNEGTVPHKKALTEDEAEEERRMFYVAMTRAREDLRLYYVEGTKKEPVMPSRFLLPLGIGK